MSNPYELHSWSKLYRLEALEEARTRHLAEQAGAPRRKRSERSRGWPIRATRDPALGRERGPIGSISATFTKTTYWRKDLR